MAKDVVQQMMDMTAEELFEFLTQCHMEGNQRPLQYLLAALYSYNRRFDELDELRRELRVYQDYMGHLDFIANPLNKQKKE